MLNKGGSPRLMLAGHADEIAMAVNYIDDNGYLYVRKMGGVDAAITKAQRVTIHTAKGPVKGVVGNVAPHLMKLEGEPKPPKIHELFIDIGVAKRAEAEKVVRIGDPITLVESSTSCAASWPWPGHSTTASDVRRDRGAAAAQGIRRQAGRGSLCVSNVQEEVGLLGARQIAYSLKPTWRSWWT